MRLDTLPNRSYYLHMSKIHSADTSAELRRKGATLRALRTTRGITADQLAKEAQITPSHIYNIEAGRKALTDRLVAIFSEVLKVPQIALIREGYFDHEQAEHEAQLQKARKERDDASKEAVRLKMTVEVLEERCNIFPSTPRDIRLDTHREHIRVSSARVGNQFQSNQS